MPLGRRSAGGFQNDGRLLRRDFHFVPCRYLTRCSAEPDSTSALPLTARKARVRLCGMDSLRKLDQENSCCLLPFQSVKSPWNQKSRRRLVNASCRCDLPVSSVLVDSQRPESCTEEPHCKTLRL